MAKISINQEDCIGCEICKGCAPEVFEVEMENFKAKLKKKGGLVDSMPIEELSAEQLEQAKRAIEDCPTQSIKISE